MSVCVCARFRCNKNASRNVLFGHILHHTQCWAFNSVVREPEDVSHPHSRDIITFSLCQSFPVLTYHIDYHFYQILSIDFLHFFSEWKNEREMFFYILTLTALAEKRRGKDGEGGKKFGWKRKGPSFFPSCSCLLCTLLFLHAFCTFLGWRPSHAPFWLASKGAAASRAREGKNREGGKEERESESERRGSSSSLCFSAPSPTLAALSFTQRWTATRNSRTATHRFDLSANR